MKWEEAQAFNDAIAFAVYLDSNAPARNAPLALLHKRFEQTWRNHVEQHATIKNDKGNYTPQIDRALLLSAAQR